MLRVHERHGVTEEQDVGGGQPGNDGIQGGDDRYPDAKRKIGGNVVRVGRRKQK